MFSKLTLITPEATPIDSQTDYNLNEVKSLVRLRMYKLVPDVKRVRLPTISCDVMQGTDSVCSKR